MTECHTTSRRTFREISLRLLTKIWGYRNITKELKSQGVEISEYRVRRLMRENGFYPELAVKFKPQRNGKSVGR
jgi:hypothetical protein